MDHSIVAYQSGDYEALIDLWEQSDLPYKPMGRDRKEHIEKEVKQGSAHILFLKLRQEYIASVLITHDGRKGWINRLAVLRPYRRQGLARKLVEAAEQWLADQEIFIYACQIEAYNIESFEAFQRMGYIPFEGIHYLTKRKFPEI